MTNPDHLAKDSQSPAALESNIDNAVIAALAAGDKIGLKKLFQPLHHADAADLIERLSPDKRNALIDMVHQDFDPEILAELDDAVLDDVFEALGIDDVAAAVSELASDDAVEVVEELDEKERQQILNAIAPGERSLIEESLAYPQDSAGRLMQRQSVNVPPHWTLGETIDFIRQSAEADTPSLPRMFYNIFIVDPGHRPLGYIPLSRLLRNKRQIIVTDIMEAKIKLIPATMDQEEVAFLFRQRDLVSAPVIDDGGRIIGTITIDDVVDVIHEEHEEDIMLMAGVREDDLYEATIDTTRSRFSWLLANLATAVLASIVIGMFEGTIDQIVALAVLMPIVASMGGNAGTQAMTVTIRAMAMKEVTTTNVRRIIGKELMVGSINGIMFAILTGLIAWLWFGSVALGAVIAIAMTVNMIVAGLAGTTIPLMLEHNKIDPAVASSVILTTITDVVGFAAFLGLAAWLLL